MQVVTDSGSPVIVENPIEFTKRFAYPLEILWLIHSTWHMIIKKMSSSQRQAIISLIEKKGKGRNYLKRMGGQCRLKDSIQSYCS